MRILLLLTCLIAATPSLLGQIGYPSSHSNFDERKVGTYELPDLLTTSTGIHVADQKTWYNVRRPEIDRLLEEQEYGRSPSAPKAMRFEVVESSTPAFDGLALRKQIAIHLTAGDGPTLHLLLYTPANATKPAPVLLNLSFTSNANTVEDPGVKPGTVWGPNHTQVLPPPVPPERRLGAPFRFSGSCVKAMASQRSTMAMSSPIQRTASPTASAADISHPKTPSPLQMNGEPSQPGPGA